MGLPRKEKVRSHHKVAHTSKEVKGTIAPAGPLCATPDNGQWALEGPDSNASVIRQRYTDTDGKIRSQK